MTRILEKCLAKDRNDRYQSAAELSTDLRRVLLNTGQQTTVSAPEPVQDRTIASKLDPALVTGKTTGTQPNPTPTSASYVRPAASKTPSRRPLLLAGVVFVAVMCLVFALVVGRFILSGIGTASKEPTPTVALPTQTTAATEEPVAVVLATDTAVPTETALPTLTPTPEGPYVIITEIRVDGPLYIVDYEVHNLEPSQHVHMFFDTVSPDQAGSPGAGPWKLTWNTYGNPPFTQYGIANKPAGATKMCSLVANSNHTVILGSGNCVFLP
jgi:hypothetical protein